jgi:hypothetical protein
MTPDRSRLINVKPCDESFSAANGVVSKAECIGDLPVILTTSDGQHIVVVFTNVRCVPSFRYTLLSVRQLWARL